MVLRKYDLRYTKYRILISGACKFKNRVVYHHRTLLQYLLSSKNLKTLKILSFSTLNDYKNHY